MPYTPSGAAAIQGIPYATEGGARQIVVEGWTATATGELGTLVSRGRSVEVSVFQHGIERYRVQDFVTVGGNTFVIGSKLSLSMRGRGNSGYLVPRDKAQGLPAAPKVIERPSGRGHFGNWVQSCRAGKQALSNFGVAGPYTETLLMASISSRFPGQKLTWDSKNVRFTNSDEAKQLFKPDCREGWELPELDQV